MTSRKTTPAATPSEQRRSVFDVLANDFATYRVISPLNHNHQNYMVGDTVELTGSEAAPLLGHTVVLEA